MGLEVFKNVGYITFHRRFENLIWLKIIIDNIDQPSRSKVGTEHDLACNTSIHWPAPLTLNHQFSSNILPLHLPFPFSKCQKFDLSLEPTKRTFTDQCTLSDTLMGLSVKFLKTLPIYFTVISLQFVSWSACHLMPHMVHILALSYKLNPEPSEAVCQSNLAYWFCLGKIMCGRCI